MAYSIAIVAIPWIPVGFGFGWAVHAHRGDHVGVIPVLYKIWQSVHDMTCFKKAFAMALS